MQVTTITHRDGSVHAHKTGCADIKRGHAKKVWSQWDFTEWDVQSKREAFESYNADFIDDGDDACWPIEWAPCTDELPEQDVASAIERSQEITTKVGTKWTYIYRGSELIAEVRTDAAAAVVAALQG